MTKLREHSVALAECVDRIADTLRDELPGYGVDVAIDASDMPAYANGQRYLYNHDAVRGPNGRNVRSVWDINQYKAVKEAHFATFPPALVEPCIALGSNVSDLVLDPFIGSGTTGVVALKMGRRFVGIELNPEYAGIAERRLNGAVIK